MNQTPSITSHPETMPPMTVAIDIGRFLALLFEPGDVFEVRVPGCLQPGRSSTSTVSGYFTFDRIEEACKQIQSLDKMELAKGIYVTLNPVQSSLLARSANKLKDRVRETTGDKDIVKRRWMLIDIDPVRPNASVVIGWV